MYVYCYFSEDGKPLYVGSTRHVLERFRQHKHNEPWMKNVARVVVRGPYPEEEVLDFEKKYIAEEQPLFNVNSLITDGEFPQEDPYDVLKFDTVSDFESHFLVHSGAYQRATYYLRIEDLEALRMLCYYRDDEISSTVREALEIGIDALAKQLGHENIYTEARERVFCSEKWRRSKQKSRRKFH